MNPRPARNREASSVTGMVLVMGVTGAGKSRFINTLVHGSVREGHSLHSETSNCQIVEAQIGADTTVAIVDTPGFDDTHRSDAQVLAEITSFLTSQYQLGIPLRGIIYLHRITDQRMQGSALRNFRVFQDICGERALKNVVLLTTMWDRLPNRLEGFDREQELREEFWAYMEAKGSYIASFDGSKEMAEAMITMLITKTDVVLEVQRELHDEQKQLDETMAGRLLMPDLRRCLGEEDEQIEILQRRIEQAEQEKDDVEARAFMAYKLQLEEERRRHRRELQILKARVARETEAKIAKAKKESKWKSSLQIFASVTGLAVSLVFNILPLFGVM